MLFVYFNSRPHGGRPRNRKKKYSREEISTHALTEGDGMTVMFLHWDIFQLTPSRRATISNTSCSITPVFQLTPSRRATLSEIYGRHISKYFNSRPHGGRRLDMTTFFTMAAFQLTPSRRATQLPVYLEYNYNFNSRPHGGRQ